MPPKQSQSLRNEEEGHQQVNNGCFALYIVHSKHGRVEQGGASRRGRTQVPVAAGDVVCVYVDWCESDHGDDEQVALSVSGGATVHRMNGQD